MAKKRNDGKTSIWLFESTRDELMGFMMGGESWDMFLIRMMTEMNKSKMKKLQVSWSVPEGKRTTIWVNKTTHDNLNRFRKSGETWGTFFQRINSIMIAADLPRNPN